MTKPDRPERIIVRPAPEMQLKSGPTRRRFRNVLMNNLRAALNPFGTVNLERPDVRVEIDLVEEGAWLFTRPHLAPDGVPLGGCGIARSP